MKKAINKVGPAVLFAGSLLAVARISLSSGPRLTLNLIAAMVYLVTALRPSGSLRQWGMEHKLLVPAVSFSILILLLPGWGSAAVALVAAVWLGWLSVARPQP